MKTKNNVQKAVLRTAAVIASFVLISITVSAQDFWKNLLLNNSFNEIALAMAESGQNKSSADNNSSAYSGETRISSVVFKPGHENGIMHLPLWVIEIEKEPSMVLEEWMTSDSFFGGNVAANIR